MPDEDLADVRAAFARLDEDDVVPGPVGETLADRLTERVTAAPSVLEEAVASPPGAAVPGPAGVQGPAAPVAGLPAPVAPPVGTSGPHTQPTVLPAPEPAATGTPSATPAGPVGPDDSTAAPLPGTPGEPESPAEPGDPVAGVEPPADPEGSVVEPAWPESDSTADPDGSTTEPDDSKIEPDGLNVEPDDSKIESDSSKIEPGGSTGEADDSVAEPEPDDTSVEPGEQAPDDPAKEPVQSATMAAPVSKPDGWQVDSYELRAFTDAVMRARSYLDDVQAKVDRMQGAEMTPQLGTSPVGKQLAKKFDDRLNSADGLRAMLAEAMKRMADFVTSAEKAAQSYEELEENTVANLQSAKHG